MTKRETIPDTSDVGREALEARIAELEAQVQANARVPGRLVDGPVIGDRREWDIPDSATGFAVTIGGVKITGKIPSVYGIVNPDVPENKDWLLAVPGLQNPVPLQQVLCLITRKAESERERLIDRGTMISARAIQQDVVSRIIVGNRTPHVL